MDVKKERTKWKNREEISDFNVSFLFSSLGDNTLAIVDNENNCQ